MTDFAVERTAAAYCSMRRYLLMLEKRSVDAEQQSRPNRQTRQFERYWQQIAVEKRCSQHLGVSMVPETLLIDADVL